MQDDFTLVPQERDERAAFAAWADKQPLLDMDAEDCALFAREVAWLAWEARAAL